MDTAGGYKRRNRGECMPNTYRRVVQGYELIYSDDVDTPIEERASVRTVADVHAHMLTDLQPNKPYYVRVRAFNDRGNGPLTEPIVFTTGTGGE
jgi:hypothetical protein